MDTVITPVILAGGGGSRLWPLSRATRPKQLHALVGEDSLLQATAKRLTGGGEGVAFGPLTVVCGQAHEAAVVEQLAQAGVAGATRIVEPLGRNTAPAAVAAARTSLAQDADALVLLAPADHHIAAPARFRAALAQAAPAAAAGAVVTFGVTPDHPHTGYGYIRAGDAHGHAPGVFAVDAFVEKPDAATAAGYLAQGGYAWNAGLFLFRADVLLEEAAQLCPEVLGAVDAALAGAQRTPARIALDRDAFAQSPSISIDYALMEKTPRAAVVFVEMGWSDIGSWEALMAIAETSRIGDVLALDAPGCYLRSEGPLVAALGVEDLVIVATPDAVLVAHKSQSQSVKALVDRLKAQDRGDKV
ncbi:MAG: mannose-1-phosphate guanylyltransferase/mannose-6-phosphate isomerase [Maricaulaceae bacterium]